MVGEINNVLLAEDRVGGSCNSMNQTQNDELFNCLISAGLQEPCSTGEKLTWRCGRCYMIRSIIDRISSTMNSLENLEKTNKSKPYK